MVGSIRQKLIIVHQGPERECGVEQSFPRRGKLGDMKRMTKLDDKKEWPLWKKECISGLPTYALFLFLNVGRGGYQKRPQNVCRREA